MAKPIKIATIVATMDDDDQPSLDTLERALIIRGAEVRRYAAPDIAISADPNLPALLHNGKPIDADAAIVRKMSNVNFSVVATLEAAGIPVLNPLHSLQAANHKGNTNAVLQQSGGPYIPIPRTFNVYSKSAGLAAARALGYPVVIKRCEGYGGEFVRKATDEASAALVLEELEADSHETLVCDYVECAGRARRIVVVGGVAIRIGREHQAPSGEFRTQRVWGATAKVVVPTEEECQLAEAIAAVSGHGCVGIDLGVVVERHPREGALLPGSLVLFEINSQPELPSLSEATEYDFPGTIADFLLAKASHWKSGGRGNPPEWTPQQPDDLISELQRKTPA